MAFRKSTQCGLLFVVSLCYRAPFCAHRPASHGWNCKQILKKESGKNLPLFVVYKPCCWKNVSMASFSLSLPRNHVGLYFGRSLFYRCTLMRLSPTLVSIPRLVAVLGPVCRPWAKARLYIQQRSHDATDVSQACHGWMTMLVAKAVQTYGVAHRYIDFEESSMPFLCLGIALVILYWDGRKPH